MANDDAAALQSQKSSIKSQISSTESQKSEIKAELSRVTAAKEAIGTLKEEARDLQTTYGNDAIKDIEGNWIATRKVRFQYDNYYETDGQIGIYIKEIDSIHDELITREHQLTVELNRLDGKLIDLRNALSWVVSNLNKLFNWFY